MSNWVLTECVGHPPKEGVCLTAEEVMAIYNAISCSCLPEVLAVANKLKPAIDIIKHDTSNGIKRWENEGGACP